MAGLPYAELAARVMGPFIGDSLTPERLRELTQAEFDDILVAAKKYQKRAYESGEPQAKMAEFLAARKPK